MAPSRRRRATSDQEDFELDLLASGEARDDAGANDERLAGRRLRLIPHDVDERLVFRFEFGPAILAQVLEKMRPLPMLPLTSITAREAPYSGFYQLFRNGQSKYVGRTIRPVGSRLLEHSRKLRGRVPLGEMSCRFVFVEDLSLVGLSEDALIAYFHPLGLDDWGKLGFGSKVPGHGRAGQTSEWHEANPPDLSLRIQAGGRSARTLRQLITQVARGAPLTLSIPTEFRARFDATFSTFESIPEQTLSFSDWITVIERILAPAWSLQRQPMAWYIVPGPER
jgi:hypothetical protein